MFVTNRTVESITIVVYVSMSIDKRQSDDVIATKKVSIRYDRNNRSICVASRAAIVSTKGSLTITPAVLLLSSLSEPSTMAKFMALLS